VYQLGCGFLGLALCLHIDSEARKVQRKLWIKFSVVAHVAEYICQAKTNSSVSLSAPVNKTLPAVPSGVIVPSLAFTGCIDSW
jgi:hypothetical protein